MQCTSFGSAHVHIRRDSTLCKYGLLCERNICRFKHEIVIVVADEESDNSDKNSKTIIVDVHNEGIETDDCVYDIIEKDSEEILIIEKDRLKLEKSLKLVKKTH